MLCITQYFFNFDDEFRKKREKKAGTLPQGNSIYLLYYGMLTRFPTRLQYFFNFDDEFIKKRKKELETYLREVLQVACFSQVS
jgi:hypothetical protein